MRPLFSKPTQASCCASASDDDDNHRCPRREESLEASAEHWAEMERISEKKSAHTLCAVASERVDLVVVADDDDDKGDY